MPFGSSLGCLPTIGCLGKKRFSTATSADISSDSASDVILSDLKERCATPLTVLKKVADGMESDLRDGLAKESGGGLPMIPSFVESLPSGNETGVFYALDLGGTNFRVLRVRLGGFEKRVIGTEYDQVAIPQELMVGTTEELFDFVASHLATFVSKEGDGFPLPDGQKREVGFTFSFPVKQTSIDSGILIKWTKGFNVSGTAGRDVVTCLNEAMERKNLDMRVSALVNDTVSTLAGANYWDKDVEIGIILGTGTNACYIENMDKIPKLRNQKSTSSKTIINTEWGAFSSNLPLTEFDQQLDAASLNPGEQIFEKTISGMYLGEIVRRVLLEMLGSTTLFGSCVPEKLLIPFSLRTPDLCAMQQDDSNDLRNIGRILQDVVGLSNLSLLAKKAVLDVCNTIVERGGRLVGAGIVGILQKLNNDSEGFLSRKRIVVAMDGSLYEKYPQYRNYIQDAVTELLGSEISKNVVIEHKKDGSGIGAALLAAANTKYVEEDSPNVDSTTCIADS